MDYTLYDPVTGALTGRASQPGTQPAPANSVEGVFDPETHVWDGTAIVEVPDWSPVVEPNKLSGLPVDTHLRWGGADADQVIVTDGEVTFDLLPGQHLAIIAHPPGLAPKYLEVTP